MRPQPTARGSRAPTRDSGHGRTGGPLFALALCLTIALVLGGCGIPGSSSRTVVVASFYPLAFVAAELGGDRVTVHDLTPPGVEPHEWEPSPQDVSLIRRARILFYQGPGFQPALDRVVKELPAGRPLPVAATAGVELRRVGHTADMHTWLDPSLLAAAVENLRRALAQLDPDAGTEFGVRAETLKRRLADLDKEFRDTLLPCQGRGILTFHDFLTYLAARYGLRVYSMVGLEPEAEPTPERLAELGELATKGEIRAVFLEKGVETPALAAFAREHALPTGVLDSLEVRPPAGQDYFSVMKENLRSLTGALGCRGENGGGSP
jgi:zinc transport system substrate-binding protein